MISILGGIIRFFGRMFFGKITREDEIYLNNYYDEHLSMSNSKESAKKGMLQNTIL